MNSHYKLVIKGTGTCAVVDVELAGELGTAFDLANRISRTLNEDAAHPVRVVAVKENSDSSLESGDAAKPLRTLSR